MHEHPERGPQYMSRASILYEYKSDETAPYAWILQIIFFTPLYQVSQHASLCTRIRHVIMT